MTNGAGRGPGGFAGLDAIAEGHHARGGQPGLAYGIVAGDALVHAGGLGARWRGGPAPDEQTVFRIASMTKSFTAAAVLALVDDGALALDDPAAGHVPQLSGLRLPCADSPVPTVRHLLTMTAGFPTDDPWGDRQQGLPLDGFAEFLAGGVSFAWAPGTRFEYSNLGYAILGRVITAVTGQPYPEVVRERLLRPLGMSATGFADSEFAAGRLARGHRRTRGGWAEVPFDPCGAFAPMGGIFSCVRDLARWVAGLAAAFPPGEETDGGPHPLRRAARREMQAAHVALAAPAFTRLPAGPLGAGPGGYGYGLFVEEHPVWGRLVHHSGGYPGFGSHMRWHPATGTGVIVLANATYAPVGPLAARLLEAVLRREAGVPPPVASGAAPSLAPAPGGAWPATLAARRQVMALLESWDDAAAGRLFAPNVALDEPLPERRRRIELARLRLGGLAEHPGRPPESDTPAHCRWWLRGRHGEAMAEIRMSPQRPPLVQSLTLAVPPDPDSPLARALSALVSLLNGGARDWPPGLPVTGGLDTALLLRQAQLAAVWAGPCRPGGYRAGNGQRTATVELDGQHGRLLLTVAVDGAGAIAHAEILLGPATGG